jgi:hypothetical protein
MGKAAEAFYMGFYWGPRKESAEEVAVRAELFFKKLKAINPAVAKWTRASSRTLRPLVINRENLFNLFAAGVNRTDIGKEIIPDLGFSASLISTIDNGPALLRVHAGCYSKWVSNVCVFQFPPSKRTDKDLITLPTLIRLCSLTVQCWEPDEGRVTSHLLHEAIDQQNKKPEFGWLTYLSKKHGPIPPLPKPARIEPIDDKGHLIIAVDKMFSSARPKHIEAVRNVIEACALQK